MTIQRIVCFKFKPEASEADKQQHMADFAALKDAIPVIKSYRAGFSLSGDQGATPQYDTLHYMTFESMADVDIYFNHAAHQQFIADNKHSWLGEVLVLAANID